MTDLLSHYRDIVLLYSPKKVGSTSILTSIRLSASDKFAVFHTHDDLVLKSLQPENKHVFFSDIIRNSTIINKNTNLPRKIFVIDIYRPSVERKISDFFHEISSLHFFNTEENISNYNINKIIKRFNDIYPYLEDEDYYHEKYNIENLSNFDFDKKYLLYEKNNVKYIKLRLKDSHLWSDILSTILETKIEYIPDYETKDRNIGNLYKNFKNVYKLPYNFFKKIEECKYLKYYYDFTERYEYLNYWYHNLSGFHSSFTFNEYNFYKKICLENKFRESDLIIHYRDIGCLCKSCSLKRFRILYDIKNNIDNHDFIEHDNTEDLNINLIVQLFYQKDDTEWIQNMLLNV
jgi:hypothetical protein